jgi:hypothetical protein
VRLDDRVAGAFAAGDPTVGVALLLGDHASVWRPARLERHLDP